MRFRYIDLAVDAYGGCRAVLYPGWKHRDPESEFGCLATVLQFVGYGWPPTDVLQFLEIYAKSWYHE